MHFVAGDNGSSFSQENQKYFALQNQSDFDYYWKILLMVFSMVSERSKDGQTLFTITD